MRGVLTYIYIIHLHPQASLVSAAHPQPLPLCDLQHRQAEVRVPLRPGVPPGRSPEGGVLASLSGQDECRWGTDTIILYTNFILGVLLLTGLHDLSLPSDAELGVQVAGLPPVSLLPDLSYLSPNCFHPSQKLHAKSKS